MRWTTEYLDHAALTATLKQWAAEHPSLVRLDALATTPEGRELWLLTLGPEPDRARPSVLLDANMHASELTGSAVALQFAHDVLQLHLGRPPAGLAGPLVDAIREMRVYVVPRMSPDGAERVLKTGAYVRSAPRADREANAHPHWVARDLDGDGLALLMRVEDPTGEFVESDAFPGLLVPREPDDAGPFYKVLPEGLIENWDGRSIPDPFFLSDNRVDFNRNFPHRWAPESEQVGAGPFPASEPETLAMVRFTQAHPEIFLWVNLHTFGGVHIRPLGHAPDSKMAPGDLALYRLIERWATELTGYPTVPGVEFVYEPEKPLHGDLIDYAYHQRGALTWVTELWDLFEQVGLPAPRAFVDRYTHVDRDGLVKIARWDATHNAGRLVRPWRAFTHPQLGPVELGGLDPRFGLWNPPPERLPEICAAHSTLLLRASGLGPRLRVEVSTRSEGDWTRIELTVENHGYLSTGFVAAADGLGHNEPVRVVLDTDGAPLGPTRIELGHLDGWGRGRFDGGGALYFQRSRGSTGRAHAELLVRGGSRWRLAVGSCRVGWTSAEGAIDGR